MCRVQPIKHGAGGAFDRLGLSFLITRAPRMQQPQIPAINAVWIVLKQLIDVIIRQTQLIADEHFRHQLPGDWLVQSRYFHQHLRQEFRNLLGSVVVATVGQQFFVASSELPHEHGLETLAAAVKHSTREHQAARCPVFPGQRPGQRKLRF